MHSFVPFVGERLWGIKGQAVFDHRCSAPTRPVDQNGEDSRKRNWTDAPRKLKHLPHLIQVYAGRISNQVDRAATQPN
jgi:hypothetical protein